MSQHQAIFSSPSTNVTLWDVANILEYATSRMMAIHLAVERSHVPRSVVYKESFHRHVMWEAEVFFSLDATGSLMYLLKRFIFPFINICVATSVNPSMSDYLMQVVGLLARSQVCLLAPADFLGEFQNLDPHREGLALQNRLRVVPNYRCSWWKDRFDANVCGVPEMLDLDDIIGMVADHMEQMVSQFSASAYLPPTCCSLHASCRCLCRLPLR